MSSEDDDYETKTICFWRWFQQRPHTSVSPKICIADLRAQGQGRGVLATRDIEKDEELFTLPLSDVLTTENSALNSTLQGKLSRLQTWDALVLTMIYEDGRGKDSTWWPYLSILPTEFDTLIYWSTSELAELQGSAVVGKIGKDEADEHFRNDLFPIVQTDPTLFGRHAKAFTGSNAEADFVRLGHRMATLILAYGFDLEPVISSEDDEEENEDANLPVDLEKGMVPLADLLNADGDLNNAHLVQNETSMTMTAIDKITSGQQIFNDFRHIPRSDLLRRYGYVTDNYKNWDVVELPLTVICESAAKYNPLSEEDKERRLELADDWEVIEDGYDLSLSAKDMEFEIPLDLQLTIVALLFDEAHYREEKAAQRRPKETYLFSRPLNLYLVFRDAITRRKDVYATTIAQDIEILGTTRLKNRHRMAVEVRLGEKEILAVALDAASKWIEAAVGEFEDRYKEEKVMESAKRRRI
ncbi:MAG: hypothetical protein Q9217_002343 [Psora testacea]